MTNLHLLNYNNYYNRIVKKESSLSDYQGYQVKYNGQATDPYGNTAIIVDVNFIPGNFVDAVQTVNWRGDIPNYVLVVDDEVITSRWYVVGSRRTREGQLMLLLHRDLVVDFYPNLMSDRTSIFVEKATIPSSNDLIFNSEDMTFNQIKTKEILLKDDTKCPWIILYGARNNGGGQETTFESTFKTQYPSIEITEQQFNDLSTWATTTSMNQKSIYNLTRTSIYVREAKNGQEEATLIYASTQNAPAQTTTTYALATGATLRSNALSIVDHYYDSILAQLEELAPAYVNRSDRQLNRDFYNAIILNQNRVLKYTAPGETQAKYYQIKIVYQGSDVPLFPNNYSGAILTTLNPLKQAFTYDGQVKFGNNGENIAVQYNALLLQYNLVEIPEPITQGDGDRVVITANRYHLLDAPYDMFCIPLSDDLFIKNSKIQDFVQTKSNLFLNLALANQLVADYAGVGQIYDAQILPYCPISDHLMSTDDAGNLIYDINDDSPNSYSLIQASDDAQTIGYVLHASRSSFAFNIDLEEPVVIVDYKLESECDLYRLNSPNYAGVFEFNAAKNGGITTFNVKCTYKPFNPYIKLYPDFGRLYGNDFNDARGLICNGDFSLPTLTDQWKTFELSNKNYQASFDRQIQNLELNNAVQRSRQKFEIAAGTVSAGVNGASTGAMAGGPMGAVAGGVIGSSTSLFGGILDYRYDEILRQEAIDYAQDQFGYQLGNIQALPQTLSRTSAYNIDNKYFPFLEYYTCSDVEKEALQNKIKFNGMTVMAIGTMKYYKENYTGADPMYFKGKLIRLEGFTGDFHILNAIAAEIYKGVFI